MFVEGHNQRMDADTGEVWVRSPNGGLDTKAWGFPGAERRPLGQDPSPGVSGDDDKWGGDAGGSSGSDAASDVGIDHGRVSRTVPRRGPPRAARPSLTKGLRKQNATAVPPSLHVATLPVGSL